MQKGMKDKIILHEAGEKTCKIPVRNYKYQTQK